MCCCSKIKSAYFFLKYIFLKYDLIKLSKVTFTRNRFIPGVEQFKMLKTLDFNADLN